MIKRGDLKCQKKDELEVKLLPFVEAEKIDLENKVKLSGEKTKQEYIISALLNHKIEAVGNPLMFLQFKRVLERIELMVKDGEGIDEELKNCLFEMLKILESFEKSNKVL